MDQTTTFPAHLHHTTVNNIMTPAKNLTTITETTPLTDIITLLQNHDHLWVVPDTNPHHLTGIITTTDALTTFTTPTTTHDYDKPSPTSLSYNLPLTAKDLMTPKPYTLTPTDTLHTAATLMKDNKITQLPVIDDTQTLLGEITSRHLLTLYLQQPHH